MSNNDQPGTLLLPHSLRFTSQREENMRRVRARCRAVYLGERVALCWVLGRYKFYVQSTDIGFGAHLMMDGYWEMWATEFMARCIRPGMTVLDLGASYGYFTLLAADLAGSQGKVIAFEPNPPIAQLLRHNIDVNGFSSNVTIESRAVWDKTGELVTFVVPEEEPKNARVTDVKLDGTQFRHIQVPSLALDDLQDQKVDFMKADIEGAEERMWVGMQKVLARNPDAVFLIEFAASRCNNPRAVLEQMSQLFPLQYLDVWSKVQPATIEQILGRNDDWMLVLSRNPLPAVQ
jgi:FkbM family methyltransferase